MGPYSLNNQLVLEKYKTNGSMKAVERNGMSFISQKVSVVGLKVLLDAKLANGTYVRKGATAYIKEALLFSQPWAKETLQSNAIEGEFMLIDAAHVSFIVPEAVKENVPYASQNESEG